MAGQTEEARQQLAQLAIVRARREAAAKKREAEGRKPGMSANGIDSDQDISNNNKAGAAESSDEEDSEDDSEEDVKGKGPAKAAAATLAAKKKAAALAPVETNGELPKLKAMDIKKMNGDALKEHLKARELSVQGQKKDLIKRLCDYEAARD